MIARSFAELLTLAAVVTCPAGATAPLQTLPVDSSIIGIRLIGPSDPEFNAAVARIPSANLKHAFLPYSVIVANQSGQQLLSVTVRFEVTSPAGRVSPFLDTIVWDGLLKPVSNPGGETIITLPELRRSPPGAPLSENLWPAEDVAYVTASVDLVIYAHGFAPGPNTGNTFARTSSHLRAILDVCDGVQQAGSSGMIDYLTTLASNRVNPPGPFNPDEYAFYSYEKARSLLSMNKFGGTDPVASYCSTVAQSIPSLLESLHR
jgi:hypothetical protein